MNGRIGLLGILVLCVGCVPGPTQNTTLVPGNPFNPGTQGNLPALQELSPEAKQESIRVAQVGQQILGANPQLPIKPQFIILGGPTEELFHRGSQDIFITEGLARQCTSDGQAGGRARSPAAIYTASGQWAASRRPRRQRLPGHFRAFRRHAHDGTGQARPGGQGPPDQGPLTRYPGADLPAENQAFSRSADRNRSLAQSSR
jgi:hypothetical protein